ncbi:MAG TPA: hypothetical protein VG755_40965, partial [Nannocystaceae bacterium]|nr:hypothetical protein [Nannocystaceae bacterium]
MPFLATLPIPPELARALHHRIARERRWLLAGRVVLALVFVAVTVMTAMFAIDARDPEGRHPPGMLVLVFFGFVGLVVVIGAGVLLALVFPRTRRGRLGMLALVGSTALVGYLGELADAQIIGVLAVGPGMAAACIGVGHLLGIPFAPLSSTRLRVAQRDVAAGVSWRFSGARFDPESCDDSDDDPDALPLGTIDVTHDVLPNAAIVIDDLQLKPATLRPIAAPRVPDPDALYRGHDDRVPLPTRPMLASERLELRERLRLHDASTACLAFATLVFVALFAFALLQHGLELGTLAIPLGVAAAVLGTASVLRRRLHHRGKLVADLDG